jgi:PKHD-type hydroxylase
MQIKKIFPQEERDMTNWYWFANGFSHEEIEKVHFHARQIPSEDGITYGTVNPDTSYRKSRIGWLHMNDSHEWLYDKLMNMVVEANQNVWGFDLHTAADAIQYTEYLGGGGHYDYHLDLSTGASSLRKVSVIVQLSDPTSYEGGKFQILRSKEEETLPDKQGAVLIFPSYILHRVTPVLSGTRRSLVMWVGGSHYR